MKPTLQHLSLNFSLNISSVTSQQDIQVGVERRTSFCVLRYCEGLCLVNMKGVCEDKQTNCLFRTNNYLPLDSIG